MKETIPAHASAILNSLFCEYQGPPFAVRLWDGWTWKSSAAAEPACTLAIASPAALRALVLHPGQIALGEAFLDRQIEIEGDLFCVFEAAEHLLRRPLPLPRRMLRGRPVSAPLRPVAMADGLN